MDLRGIRQTLALLALAYTSIPLEPRIEGSSRARGTPLAPPA
jgi:hypothetical protein